MQWSSDLIGYDALTSYGSPSYYAQMMFSTMVGDELLATESQNIPTRQWQARAMRGSNPPPARQIREVFSSATRNSTNGTIYLKVVNASGSARPIDIQLDGARIDPEGEVVSLVAGGLDDTNSLEQPKKLGPRTERAGGFGARFSREFPPYSITVLQLKTR
jgi:alpha-N-arabinofuranosidase